MRHSVRQKPPVWQLEFWWFAFMLRGGGPTFWAAAAGQTHSWTCFPSRTLLSPETGVSSILSRANADACSEQVECFLLLNQLPLLFWVFLAKFCFFEVGSGPLATSNSPPLGWGGLTEVPLKAAQIEGLACSPGFTSHLILLYADQGSRLAISSLLELSAPFLRRWASVCWAAVLCYSITSNLVLLNFGQIKREKLFSE